MTNNPDGYNLEALASFVEAVESDTMPDMQDMIAVKNALRDIYRGVDLHRKLGLRSPTRKNLQQTIHAPAYGIVVSYLNGSYTYEEAVEVLVEMLHVESREAEKYIHEVRESAEKTRKVINMVTERVEQLSAHLPPPESEQQRQRRDIKEDKALSPAQKLKRLRDNCSMTH